MLTPASPPADRQPVTVSGRWYAQDWDNFTPLHGEAGTGQMTLGEFQRLIRTMYHDKDAARGVEGTFMWLTEEIGELATALRSGTPEEQSLEFADVLAWLATIANVVDVDLDAAVAAKYGGGCPGCGQTACICPDAEKP